MNEQDQILDEVTNSDYKYGFVSNIDTETIAKGLNEDVVRLISEKKNEPEWLLEYRLKAFRKWQQMEMPEWAHLKIPEIDYQDIIYYAAPKPKENVSSLDEVDPELIDTFNKLGISLDEQKRLTGVAVDAVVDSVSVKTTFSETLAKHGIIFSSFSEAVQEHPELVKKIFGVCSSLYRQLFWSIKFCCF
jgi:Fe-S cluster assembly protein SufB